MPIIDIDEMIEKEEPFRFKIKGKIYEVPNRTYAISFKVAKLSKLINDAMKEDDLETLLKKNIEMLSSIVPKLTAKYIEENLTVDETRLIFQIINKSVADQMKEEGNPLQSEVEYYRSKMGDTYRKNEKVGEKKQ